MSIRGMVVACVAPNDMHAPARALAPRFFWEGERARVVGTSGFAKMESGCAVACEWTQELL